MTTERDLRNQFAYAREEKGMEIAAKMLAAGVDKEQISMFTGLTPEQIAKLQESI